MNVNEILGFLKSEESACEYFGDRNLQISDFCSIYHVKSNSITWIRDTSKFNIRSLDASLGLLIVASPSPDEDISGYNVICCANPRQVYFDILSSFFLKPVRPCISPTAIVKTDILGIDVSIGHNSYIGPEVSIGNNVIIRNNVSIECRASIGDNTIINSGVVIGTDGFGYYKKKDGANIKVPHFGGVRIGKDVEIGANTCIDRGTLDDTVIEDNVKIDDLCAIAHNAHIKKKTNVVALCAICGSSVLEERVYVAPGASIMNQVIIGENSVIGMGAVVTQNVTPNKVVVATSARVISDNTGVNKGIS